MQHVSYINLTQSIEQNKHGASLFKLKMHFVQTAHLCNSLKIWERVHGKGRFSNISILFQMKCGVKFKL